MRAIRHALGYTQLQMVRYTGRFSTRLYFSEKYNMRSVAPKFAIYWLGKYAAIAGKISQERFDEILASEDKPDSK